MRQLKSKSKAAYGVLRVIMKEERQALKYLADILLKRNRSINRAYYCDENGFAPPPPYITFCITDYCNLRCKMCPFQHSRIERHILPLNLIKRVVDEIYDFTYYINLCGRGEPFLHPDLFKIIEYVKARNLICAVGTNGTLLKEKAEDLINSGVDILNVSIDSVGEKHDEIRGLTGTFEKVLDGLRKIQSIRSPYNPIVTVNYTITGYGYRDLLTLYEIVKEIGIDILTVALPSYIRTPYMLQAQENLFKDFPLPTDELSWGTVDVGSGNINLIELYNIKKELLAKDEGVLISLTPDFFSFEDLEKYCQFKGFVYQKETKCAWQRASVASNGDLITCDVYRLGNLENSNFLSVWNNENYRKVRQLLKSHKRFPICATCCQYYASM